MHRYTATATAAPLAAGVATRLLLASAALASIFAVVNPVQGHEIHSRDHNHAGIQTHDHLHQPSTRLLDDAPGSVPLAALAEPMVIRSRVVSIRFDDLAASAQPSGSIHFNLFDDAAYTAVFDHHHLRHAESYTWIGKIEQDHDGGWFILTVHDGVAVANIWTANDRSFEIRPAGEGSPHYLVSETSQAEFAPCATCEAQAVAPGAEPGGGGDGHGHRDAPRAPVQTSSCSDDGSVIDVLVIYTAAARSAAGGVSAIEALIHAAVDASNHAYDHSEINTQLRLVHVAPTDYVESSGSFSPDLNRLRDTDDGDMDEVHDLREQYGADMVALMREGGGSCGIAYIMTNLSTGFASSAFSVTRRSCAVGNLTFAHELGHNMGSAHDRDNAGSSLFYHSFGYRWFTTGGSHRRSVMAYSPGTRVPHFSNPNVLNGGVPTGVASPTWQAADNALSINTAAWTVANFRQSICPAPANNTCMTALVVPAGVYPFTNYEATTDGPNEAGSCNIGSDVWFGHVAACDGELTISLCDSSFDTTLAVYDFTCPDGPGEFLACNSSFCGQQAQVTIPVTVGQALRIRVGGHAGAQGEGVLTIDCEPVAPPCAADIVSDGAVDVSDLLHLLAAWGECTGCAADLTGDEIVDVSDLLELLANWGPCPS